MKTKFAKFAAPVLGGETKEQYSNLYGDAGEIFVDILNTSPNEIAVLSKLIAFIAAKREA